MDGDFSGFFIMAIIPESNYPGNIIGGNANYPWGQARNVAQTNDGTGTPYEQAIVNDLFGLQQALLSEAGVSPSGAPDTALASQYLDAMKILLKTGRKNLLYGNFFINQRQVVGTVGLSSGEYGHDGYKGGSGGASYTFTDNGGVVTAVITGTLVQIVEGENHLGGNVVLSWQGTCQARINGGSYGTSGNVVANVSQGADITVEFGAGSLSLPQLEMGTLATEFEYRSLQHEQNLCERYVRVFGHGLTGFFRTSISVWVSGIHSPMRATPVGTLLTTSPSFKYASIGLASGDVQFSGATLLPSSSSNEGFNLSINGGPGGHTFGDPVICTTDRLVILSAEM